MWFLEMGPTLCPEYVVSEGGKGLTNHSLQWRCPQCAYFAKCFWHLVVYPVLVTITLFVGYIELENLTGFVLISKYIESIAFVQSAF